MRHYLYFNTVLYFAFVKDSINNPCPIILFFIFYFFIFLLLNDITKHNMLCYYDLIYCIQL